MGKMIELVAGDGFRLSAYRADPDGARARWLGDRAGDIRRQQSYQEGLRRLCGRRLSCRCAGVVRPLRKRRRYRLHRRRHCARPSIEGEGVDRLCAARCRRSPRRSSHRRQGRRPRLLLGRLRQLDDSIALGGFFVRGGRTTAEACSRRWANARNVRYWRISASVIRCFPSMACASSPPRIRP